MPRSNKAMRQTANPSSEIDPWTCSVLCFPMVKGIGRKSYKEHMEKCHPTLKMNYKNVGLTGHHKAKNWRRYGKPLEA